MILDEDWSDSVPIDSVFMNPVTLLVLKSTLLPGKGFWLEEQQTSLSCGPVAWRGAGATDEAAAIRILDIPCYCSGGVS